MSGGMKVGPKEFVLIEKHGLFQAREVTWQDRIIKYLRGNEYAKSKGIYFSKEIPGLVKKVLESTKEQGTAKVGGRLDTLKNSLAVIKESQRYTAENYTTVKAGRSFFQTVSPKLLSTKQLLEIEHAKLDFVWAIQELKNCVDVTKPKAYTNVLTKIYNGGAFIGEFFKSNPDDLKYLVDNSTIISDQDALKGLKLFDALLNKNGQKLLELIKNDEKSALQFFYDNKGSTDDLQKLIKNVGNQNLSGTLKAFENKVQDYIRATEADTEFAVKSGELGLKIQNDKSTTLTVNSFKKYMQEIVDISARTKGGIPYNMGKTLTENLQHKDESGLLTQFKVDLIDRKDCFVIKDSESRVESGLQTGSKDDFLKEQTEKIYTGLSKEEAEKWGPVIQSVVTQRTRNELDNVLAPLNMILSSKFQKQGTIDILSENVFLNKEQIEQLKKTADVYQLGPNRPMAPIEVSIIRGKEGKIEALEVSINSRMDFGLKPLGSDLSFVPLGIGGVEGKMKYRATVNSEGHIEVSDFSHDLKMYDPPVDLSGKPLKYEDVIVEQLFSDICRVKDLGKSITKTEIFNAKMKAIQENNSGVMKLSNKQTTSIRNQLWAKVDLLETPNYKKLMTFTAFKDNPRRAVELLIKLSECCKATEIPVEDSWFDNEDLFRNTMLNLISRKFLTSSEEIKKKGFEIQKLINHSIQLYE